jgi:hypothetical protein
MPRKLNQVMTSTGRLKRSCFCAVVAVIASAGAVLIVGFSENQANGMSSGRSGLFLDLLGIPLAPGWFMTKGLFEKAGNLSSLDQIVVPALLAALISAAIDTGLIFMGWELYRKMTRISDSDTLHTN